MPGATVPADRNFQNLPSRTWLPAATNTASRPSATATKQFGGRSSPSSSTQPGMPASGQSSSLSAAPHSSHHALPAPPQAPDGRPAHPVASTPKRWASMKIKFFMNISHEIRTPLTLIITPLLSLIKEDKEPHRQGIYEIIRKNS